MSGCTKLFSTTIVCVLFTSTWLFGQSAANDVAAAKKLAKRIDNLIEIRWKGTKVRPAEPADKYEFFRRLSLDLRGYIPSLLEMRNIEAEDTPGPEFWIETFLNDPQFPAHFSRVFSDIMLPEGNNNIAIARQRKPFEDWLEYKIRNNEPFDKVARNLLTGLREPGVPGNPSAFYVANGNTSEGMATVTARVLLGVKLECAQCHEHPFAEWSRDQFWQTAAFFNRKNVQYGPRGFARPKITIAKTERTVNATFLDGSEPANSNPDNGPTVLADWIATKENPFFARAMVDHVWTYFFGVSLLEQIQEGEEGTIKHKKLLDTMAKDFADRNFDMKYLVRAIVYSKAYGRSSRPATNSTEAAALFAHMPVRSLTAEQIFDSFCKATYYKEEQNFTPNRGFVNPNVPLTPRQKFVKMFSERGSRTEKRTSILQALFLMNDSFVNERISQKSNESLRFLSSSDYDAAEAVNTLYIIVLSRPANQRELRQLTPYVLSGGPTNNRGKAMTDIYWALLNSSEFMLNH